MPSCNNKQHGGELGSAKSKIMKGSGYGFTGKEPQFKGTYAMTGFSDCCPPTVETKDHKVNSISGILKGGAAHHNKKGGAAHHNKKGGAAHHNKKGGAVHDNKKGGAAHHNKKGGSYHKLSKKLKKGVKKGAYGLHKLSKTVLKKTRKVSKNLRKKLRGGNNESNHRDPSVRKFGCKQDKWTPDCI